MEDGLKLPLNTMEVLKKRYLKKDEGQRVIESPNELFCRVARSVSSAEKNFKSEVNPSQVEEAFYRMIRNLEFMPNSPTLMNAGTPMGQLSACFVLPVYDSIEDIFETLKNMARIHQTGGGTGFSFSNLRPKDDLVYSTKGNASGPVSFMSIFDTATGVIVQGGRRRGANMGVLRCDHPDIVEFVQAKTKEGRFSNFNLSIAVIDEFMYAVRKGKRFNLMNPRTGKKARDVNARNLFNLISKSAWASGDPGLIFIDEVNRKNPIPSLGPIEATNPCGELPLLPYESCNLGSVNLSGMVENNKIAWQKLKETVHFGIRFLDDVIDVNKFPLPQIKDITFANRKIGLGVMGFADLLIKLGIPYNSTRAIEAAKEVMRFIHTESLKASAILAGERGVFPNFKKSVYAKKNFKLRNATVNTIAPTGTISIIANCSSGIEPLFAISFVRNILSGSKLFETNVLFEEALKKRGLYNKELLARIAIKGTVAKIKEIPPDLKRAFVTAFDVRPQQHLRVQAAFQKWTDNAVSKTINLPADATVRDVRNIYLMAHSLKCKGITIYRYGTKKEQVLSFGCRPERLKQGQEMLTAEPEYSGGCVGAICSF